MHILGKHASWSVNIVNLCASRLGRKHGYRTNWYEENFVGAAEHGFRNTRKRQVAKILTRNVTQEFVKSIIELQFNIKWKTETGEPADYTYYEFCDNTNTTKLLKYIPRQAHVKATPYKKCRNDTDDRLKGITQKQLCPTVYIRTTEKWKTWEPENDKFKDVEATWSLCM